MKRLWSMLAFVPVLSLACSGSPAPEEEAASSEQELTLADLLGQRGGQIVVQNLAKTPAITLMRARFKGKCSNRRRIGLNCTYSPPDDDCPARNEDAGTIVLSSGPASFSLAPLADHSYAPRVDVRPPPGVGPFPPGAVVTATAAGAGIPAFTLSGTMAPDIGLASPGVFGSGGYVLDTSEDLRLSWSGTGAKASDFVSVQIDATADVFGPDGRPSSAPHPGTTVECVFPASLGAGVVPSSVLNLVPKGVGSAATTGAPGSSAPRRVISFKSEAHKVRLIGGISNPQLVELVTVGSVQQTLAVTVQ